MVHLTTILMFVIAIASVVTSYQSRDFDSMVFYITNRHPSDYSSYGCWCGTNSMSANINNTVDATDLCCKTHAECRSNVQASNTSCDADGKYHALYHKQQVQCVDNRGTANYEFCMCDQQAAQCFKQSFATYNPDNNNISSTVTCQPQNIHVCVPECPSNQACANGVCVGTGELGISLTWSRAGDGDIHITTPNDRWIYFKNLGPSSLTDQGKLDHDNRNGTGPENVFWNSTAPTGVYHICFDQYSFSARSSVAYPIVATFLIRKPGKPIETLTKTFTSGSRLNDKKCNPALASYVGSVNYP